MDDSEEPDTVIFSEREVLSDDSIALDEVQERVFVQDDEEEYKSLVCSPNRRSKIGEEMS